MIMAKSHKEWTEAELIYQYQLRKITGKDTPLMRDWLDVNLPQMEDYEEKLFEVILNDAQQNIGYWAEEDLKMNFITYILRLGKLTGGDSNFVSLFEKKLSGLVEGIKLNVRTDFLVARGFKNMIQEPYFHFQEYKPSLNPTGEPMAQLIQAILLGQVQNQHANPIYGAIVVGATWNFVVMEGKEYCVSKLYDSTDKDELLRIIAILRKFRNILETKFLK
jgi:hypothetical protein